VKKIYLDLGAWNGDSILEFQKYFKDKDYSIFAFECEPRLRKELIILGLEHSFNVIFKAAGLYNGLASLYPGIENYTQSSSLLPSKTTYIDKKNSVIVKSIDFSQWLMNNFEEDDFIICKMNIEGMEYDLLENMIEDGSIRFISYLFISWHYHKLEDFPVDRHHALLKKLIDSEVEFYSWNFIRGQKDNPFVKAIEFGKCRHCGELIDKHGECKNYDECPDCGQMFCTYDYHDCEG